MVRLRRRQRAVLSDKVPDAANLALGALFFGQLLAERSFSTRLALFGVACWAGFFALGLYFATDDSP